MNNQENFFDSKMIANFLIALALLFSAVYYYNYSEEIEREINVIIVDSLKDVNNSLAEQDTARR